MAKRNFVDLVSNGYKKCREGEITGVHFFRDLLIHLCFWSRRLTIEHKEVSQVNVFLAWLLQWTAFTTMVLLCPVSIYIFSTSHFDDFVVAIGFGIVTIMVTLIICCFSYRVGLFDDSMLALEAMKNAAGYYHVQPTEILDESKNLTCTIVIFYCAFVFVILPPTAVAIAVFSYVYRELPIRLWIPLDYRPSPEFEFILVIYDVCIISGVHLMVAVSCLLTTFLVETVKHLQILNFNLAQIVSPSNDSVRSTKKSTQLQIYSTKFSADLLLPRGSAWDVTKETQNSPPVEEHHCDRKMEGLGFKNVTRPEEATCKRVEMIKRVRVMDLKIKRDRILHDFLRKCLVHHQSIIRFVRAFHKAYDLLLLYNFCCCVFPVILGIIYIKYTPRYDWKIGLFCTLIISSMIELFVVSWLGDKVAEESSLVREAIYSCDWTGQSESFKRSMRIMMSQANQPLVLKVFGFIPLTVETYYYVMKLMFTYYMSLEAAMKKETVKI